MAYGVRYKFAFESQAGVSYEIQILQKSYSGAVTQRALGRSPVLRRELNDCVSGSSLEIFAESLIDGEFAALYTSDAFEYKVVLYQGSLVLWTGFVSPELYSEPDIAPPYDVSITATDGLGELRSVTYTGGGRQSLRAILTQLLSGTGLSRAIYLASSMAVEAPSQVPANQLLDNLQVDIDHMNGQSCYEVLQALLASLHARIVQSRDKWLIYRETDLEEVNGSIVVYNSAGTAMNYPVETFGSMLSHAWWPVGQMTNVVVPANKETSVLSENIYKQVIPNGEINSDSEWTTSSVTYDDKGYYQLPSGSAASIWQIVTLVPDGAALPTNATQTASGGYNPVRLPIGAQGTLGLRVLASCMGAGETEGTIQIYVEGTFTDGQVRFLKRLGSGFIWEPTRVNTYLHLPIGAPIGAADQGAATEVSVNIPIYSQGVSSSVVASMKIYVGAGTEESRDGYTRQIYAVVAEFIPQSAGLRSVVRLDNEAREKAAEVDSILVPLDATDEGSLFNVRYGIPYVGNQPAFTFSSGKLPASDYLSFISRDYALSSALPRLRMTGVLNVPAGIVALPIALKDSRGLLYFPSTMAWSLHDDEMEVDMVSIPAAALTIETEVITEVFDSQGSAFSSDFGGSGGGSLPPYETLDWASIKALNSGSSLVLPQAYALKEAYMELFDSDGRALEAVNAYALGGHAASYFATAVALTSLETTFQNALLGKLDKNVWDSILEIKTAPSGALYLRVRGGLTADWMTFEGAAESTGGGGGQSYSQRDWAYIVGMTADIPGDLASAYAVKQAYDQLAAMSTNVSFSQSQTGGTLIGVITIDDVAQNIYAPSSIAWGNVTGKPTFAAVATSGSYNDLSNKPTIPTIPSTYAWSAITSTPTTIAGYGITDAITTSNIGSQSVAYATSAGALTTGGSIAAQANSNRSVFFQNYITFDSNASYGIYRGSYASGKLGAADLYIYAQNAIVLEAGKIGIGTTEPLCALEVAATHKDINATNIAASANFFVGRHNDDGLFVGHDYTKKGSWLQSAYYGTEANPSNEHTYKLFLNPLGGNVLIGTTSDGGSDAKLQVNGRMSLQGVYNPSITASNIASLADIYIPYATYNFSLAYSGQSGNVYLSCGENDSSLFYNILLQPFGGNVGIGTTSPAYKLDVAGVIHSSTGIWSEGWLSFSDLSSTSDARFKKDIKAISSRDALRIIKALKPCSWTWNELSKTQGRGLGFIAQEMQGILPEAIREIGDDKHLAINYQMLHALEVASIQKHDDEITRLRRRVESLEKEIDQLRRTS